MASCWRAMKAQGAFEPKIVCLRELRGDRSAPPFGAEVTAGLDVTYLSEAEANSWSQVAERIASIDPAGVVVAGWKFRGYAALFRSAAHQSLSLVLGCDNPYRGDWRQRLGYWRVRPLLQRADRIAVPGKRGAALMDFWRVPASKVFRGLYGVDDQAWDPCGGLRRGLPDWPRRFLFVGRLDERKGVDLLLAAYARYRQQVADPWELRLVGCGPLDQAPAGQAGVTHLPYVAPRDLPREMVAAGAFVLASRYDAWPLAIVEAAAAGLPIIASDACGSSDELVTSQENGLIVPSGSVSDLGEALIWFDQHADVLPRWGDVSRVKAAPYSASRWARTWGDQLAQTIQQRAPKTEG